MTVKSRGRDGSGRKSRRLQIWLFLVIALIPLGYLAMVYVPIAIDQSRLTAELKAAKRSPNGKAEVERYRRKQDGQLVGVYTSSDYMDIGLLATKHYSTRIYFKGNRVRGWDTEIFTVAP